jgi:hypothetical protein
VSAKEVVAVEVTTIRRSYSPKSAAINAICAHLAELGIVAPVCSNGVRLRDVIAKT